MKRKPNTSPKWLAVEKKDVLQFIFEETSPAGIRVKTPMSQVFDAYLVWREAHGLSETQLTVDGFGRLFPHHYTRKSAYYKPVGRSLKCIFGMKVSS